MKDAYGTRGAFPLAGRSLPLERQLRYLSRRSLRHRSLGTISFAPHPYGLVPPRPSLREANNRGCQCAWEGLYQGLPKLVMVLLPRRRRPRVAPAPKHAGRIEAEAPRQLLRDHRGDVLGVGRRPYRDATAPSRVRYRARTFAPRRILRRLPLRRAPPTRCASDPLRSGLGRARTAPPATVACFARRSAG